MIIGPVAAITFYFMLALFGLEYKAAAAAITLLMPLA
tara:strand:+ start:2427 stop:2537 length:111 start_codon:yes stop_codon:yes gene_type:complete